MNQVTPLKNRLSE